MHKSAWSPGTRDVGLVRLAGGFGTNLNCEEWVVGKQKGHAQQKHAFLLPTPELKPNTRGVTWCNTRAYETCTHFGRNFPEFDGKPLVGDEKHQGGERYKKIPAGEL